MPVNTRIQVRRGYSSSYASGVIGSTPTGVKWTNSIQLEEGEIGYEIDTGRFKIGKYIDGSLATWINLPYAGGSDLNPGSGIGTIFDSSTNKYTIHSPLSSGSNITLSQYSVGGNGLTHPSGSGFTIGLKSNITGITSITNSVSGNTFYTSGPASGQSIVISGYSGVFIHGGSGRVTTDDLFVNGELVLGGAIDITLVSDIYARGAITYSGDPTVFKGNTYFSNTPLVGPSGGTVGIDVFPVSLSGHQHVYTDITNFCSGVASCVDTALVASTGLRLDFINNSATLSLSGQALALHNLSTNGLITRSGTNILARTIGASGTNIWIGNGDGVLGNPSVGLNPNLSITSLTTTGDVTVGGNLVIGGDTITANVSTMQVEDPVITLGGTGTIINDGLDRGILFRYWGGAGAATTGFMGWDSQNSEFSFLSSTTGTIDGNDYGAGTLGRIKLGSLVSTGAISGSNIFVTGATNSTIAIFDGNKQLVSTGSPTLTELSHLSGVSSSIQTQLNNKLASDRTITPGSGLDGSTALSLSGNPTLNVGAGYGISVLSDTVAVDTNVVVIVTGTQTVSGVKTFDNGSTTNVGIKTLSNGTGTLTFQDGSDTATISWQGLANNLVFDSNVSGTFDFKKSIRYTVPSTSTTSTFIPVFTGTDPTNGLHTITARSISNLKSDLSLNNVSNNSQMIAYAGRTSGYIPTWSGTDGTTLNNGYSVSSSTSSNSVVLRDNNESFAARLITVSGISGSLTWDSKATYVSNSISGVSSTTYLVNFIIDGGTP